VARLKTAVLISGRGSNLQSLIEAAAAPGYPAEIVLVLSNRAAAAGLDRAREAGIPARIVPHRGFADRECFEAAIDAALREAGVELVCLAGFMRVLTPWFVERWRDRLINIHPSLLPAFPGLHTHERAIAAGTRFAGCTIHYVRAGLDDGPIIAQAAVPVFPDDDAGRLADRVLVAEHRLYPLALRLVAEGRARIVGERVLLEGTVPAAASLLNPAG
jgi:phosphoribosylglycinamide formyltransferase 1